MKTPQLDFLIADLQATVNQEKEATQDDIDLLWEMLSIKLLLRDQNLDRAEKCGNRNCFEGNVYSEGGNYTPCKVCK